MVYLCNFRAKMSYPMLTQVLIPRFALYVPIPRPALEVHEPYISLQIAGFTFTRASFIKYSRCSGQPECHEVAITKMMNM